MRAQIIEAETEHTPLTLAQQINDEAGLIVLQSALFQSPDVRFSLVAARPFAQLEADGSRCRLRNTERESTHYSNPWHLLDHLLLEYELLEEPDLPFPLGGAFGYWGYEMNRQLSDKLASKAARMVEVPDLCLGFYNSLCVFDHPLQKAWIVSTGMQFDGSRSATVTQENIRWWTQQLQTPPRPSTPKTIAAPPDKQTLGSNLSREEFIERVERAKDYIHSGDIYQINLSHRLELPFEGDCLDVYNRLTDVSPAPYAAYLDFGGGWQIASASPESFLRISGRHIRTRPIKGTRPRSNDPQRDAQLTYELQSSPKELAELIMITDLLRNDLGQICGFGSVTVPDLVRLERYPQVQHLVSTVEGTLRTGLTHVQALAACFPGGSITGAPKLRAMQIIDELEPIARGPYTGAIGFVGFNRESHFSIGIRTALRVENRLFFNVGAGIVADSDPAAEYEETIDKAQGFLETLSLDRWEFHSQHHRQRLAQTKYRLPHHGD
ncbi:MAG: Aminodeoxychorismate synthase component 1 [Verrucomicrobia subdivision 3 bacterium]|nr:Aminodeoxychorismate synthase component 1 [Limisphaerales bacterium]MCS1414673.1 Aminodeoxychorismate synthase component 1 [Limisphaerales bacterium]